MTSKKWLLFALFNEKHIKTRLDIILRPRKFIFVPASNFCCKTCLQMILLVNVAWFRGFQVHLKTSSIHIWLRIELITWLQINYVRSIEIVVKFAQQNKIIMLFKLFQGLILKYDLNSWINSALPTLHKS